VLLLPAAAGRAVTPLLPALLLAPSRTAAAAAKAAAVEAAAIEAAAGTPSVKLPPLSLPPVRLPAAALIVTRVLLLLAPARPFAATPAVALLPVPSLLLLALPMLLLPLPRVAPGSLLLPPPLLLLPRPRPAAAAAAPEPCAAPRAVMVLAAVVLCAILLWLLCFEAPAWQRGCVRRRRSACTAARRPTAAVRGAWGPRQHAGLSHI
jgi:hypothetical protein